MYGDKLMFLDSPHSSTQVYIFCYEQPDFGDGIKARLISKEILESLADELSDVPSTLGASTHHNARKKVVRRLTNSPDFQAQHSCDYGRYMRKHFEGSAQAEIHVFCPPLLQYVIFALTLAPPDDGLKACELDVIIHPDIRLLGGENYSKKEKYECLLQLQYFISPIAELEETTNGFVLGEEQEQRRQLLAARFDQVWLDQQAMASATDKAQLDVPSASEYFKATKEHRAAALLIVMGCPEICKRVTSTAPLVSPDNEVQDCHIYRLEEFEDVDNTSYLRWNAKEFCRVDTPYARRL